MNEENEPFVEESCVEIKRAENGACDLIILDYFKQYDPGYRISVETGRHAVEEKHVTVCYWLHELEQAIKLFNALAHVADSEVEK